MSNTTSTKKVRKNTPKAPKPEVFESESAQTMSIPSIGDANTPQTTNKEIDEPAQDVILTMPAPLHAVRTVKTVSELTGKRVIKIATMNLETKITQIENREIIDTANRELNCIIRFLPESTNLVVAVEPIGKHEGTPHFTTEGFVDALYKFVTGVPFGATGVMEIWQTNKNEFHVIIS